VLEERGELVEGELLALAGLAGGMQWFCSIVQV
jgi:3-oxoacyl-[acyl-carrier-protein] synthase-3